MEERNINQSAVPAEITVWSKVKNFLLQEITVELTPKQEKVFKEVSDFWHQEITGQDVRNFLFQPISGKDIRNFLFQEIEIK